MYSFIQNFRQSTALDPTIVHVKTHKIIEKCVGVRSDPGSVVERLKMSNKRWVWLLSSSISKQEKDIRKVNHTVLVKVALNLSVEIVSIVESAAGAK